jgi:hypothetical protein
MAPMVLLMWGARAQHPRHAGPDHFVGGIILGQPVGSAASKARHDYLAGDAGS